MYAFKGHRTRETETENVSHFPCVDSLLKSLQWPGLGKVEQCSLRVCYVGGRNPVTGAIATAPQGLHLQEAGGRSWGEILRSGALCPPWCVSHCASHLVLFHEREVENSPADSHPRCQAETRSLRLCAVSPVGGRPKHWSAPGMPVSRKLDQKLS